MSSEGGPSFGSLSFPRDLRRAAAGEGASRRRASSSARLRLSSAARSSRAFAASALSASISSLAFASSPASRSLFRRCTGERARASAADCSAPSTRLSKSATRASARRCACLASSSAANVSCSLARSDSVSFAAVSFSRASRSSLRVASARSCSTRACTARSSSICFFTFAFKSAASRSLVSNAARSRSVSRCACSTMDSTYSSWRRDSSRSARRSETVACACASCFRACVVSRALCPGCAGGNGRGQDRAPLSIRGSPREGFPILGIVDRDARAIAVRRGARKIRLLTRGEIAWRTRTYLIFQLGHPHGKLLGFGPGHHVDAQGSAFAEMGPHVHVLLRAHGARRGDHARSLRDGAYRIRRNPRNARSGGRRSRPCEFARRCGL